MCWVCSLISVGGGWKERPGQVFNYILMRGVGGESSPRKTQTTLVPTWNAPRNDSGSTEEITELNEFVPNGAHYLLINCNFNLILCTALKQSQSIVVELTRCWANCSHFVNTVVTSVAHSVLMLHRSIVHCKCMWQEVVKQMCIFRVRFY